MLTSIRLGKGFIRCLCSPRNLQLKCLILLIQIVLGLLTGKNFWRRWGWFKELRLCLIKLIYLSRSVMKTKTACLTNKKSLRSQRYAFPALLTKAVGLWTCFPSTLLNLYSRYLKWTSKKRFQWIRSRRKSLRTPMNLTFWKCFVGPTFDPNLNEDARYSIFWSVALVQKGPVTNLSHIETIVKLFLV